MFFNKPRVSLHDAERMLADCPLEKCFYAKNGMVIRNVHELERAISGMDEGTFMHHVSNEKNDFASWIADVIGDYSLASRLLQSRKQDTIGAIIRKRVKSLEEHIDTERVNAHNLEEDIFFNRERIQKWSLVTLCVVLFIFGVALGMRLIG